jgi:hypothetical protein
MKWDIQQDTYVPSDKLILAMGRRVTRPMAVMLIGAMPTRTFRFAYRRSLMMKRLVWWINNTRAEA